MSEPLPGWIFRERFRLLQIPRMSRFEAARRLGWTPARLASFERGVYRLTEEDAAVLEVLTGTCAAMWMALEARRPRRRARAPSAK